MTVINQSRDLLVVREHGGGPVTVIAIHGGPAAAGDLAPLARRLGERWRALEPYQRGSGGEPLTVATHVQDLDDVIRDRCAGEAPILVGHSWGAMLALAYAAAHPFTPRGVVLIGCGTFSEEATAEFRTRYQARRTAADDAAIAALERVDTDPDRRLAALGQIATRVYGFDLEDAGPELGSIDATAHAETWADMMRLQREGVYPAAFGAIRCPVLMLHGEADPHPGRLTCDDLRVHVGHLQYRELPRCGHSPWLERDAKDQFFRTLNHWIRDRVSPSRP
jgi:pimeloyl-ACP methyl ester carboxylesterase